MTTIIQTEASVILILQTFSNLHSFLAFFPKVGLCVLHPVCVSPPPPINFWMPEPLFMKLMYITATNGVLHKSLPSVCESPLSVQGNRSVNTFPR
jgi:hypothetical protein